MDFRTGLATWIAPELGQKVLHNWGKKKTKGQMAPISRAHSQGRLPGQGEGGGQRPGAGRVFLNLGGGGQMFFFFWGGGGVDFVAARCPEVALRAGFALHSC